MTAEESAQTERLRVLLQHVEDSIIPDLQSICERLGVIEGLLTSLVTDKANPKHNG